MFARRQARDAATQAGTPVHPQLSERASLRSSRDTVGAVIDRVQFLQRTAGNQAVLARASRPKAVAEVAAGGVQSAGRKLPFAETIQRAFGRHDLGGVRAHLGPEAAEASRVLGADAYATGSDIAFARHPDLHTAAHEAAHVVQQRAGVHLKGGVGEAGDAWERHADAVASLVVQGRSAEGLLDAGAAGAGSSTSRAQAQVGPAVQLRRTSTDYAGWTCSDSGQIVLVGEQQLYADEALVTAANTKLEGAGTQGAFIKLTTGDTVHEHEGHDVKEVIPAWVDRKDMGDHKGASDANKMGALDSGGVETEDGSPMALWADCGRSAGAVTGSIDRNNVDRQVVYRKGGQEKRSRGRRDRKMHARNKNSVGRMSNAVYYELMAAFIADKANRAYLVEGVHYTTGLFGWTWPKRPASGVKAQKLYGELTPEGQEKFDREAGINAHANPDIGEAYAMSSGYDLPGFAEHEGESTWNFHWGGVVLKDGDDNVTLENYAVIAEGIERYINRDWNFAMYGTTGGDDTFHHDHLESKTHGTKATSIVVRTDK